MNGKIKLIHRILLTVSILILGASLVFYLIKWGDYPEEIGVHFDSDGGFDVVASKFFGFYPHVIGGIVIAGIAFACRLIGKKRTGLRISEKGEEHFRAELCLTLDCIALLVSLFFAYWSVCVALQQPLDTDKARLVFGLIAAASAAGIIAETVTYIRHREKAEKAAPSGLSHRLCRLIPWLLTAGAAAALAECWERFPSDEALYEDPAYRGLVYSANFDAYYDRKLLLAILLAFLVLLTVLEIISVRASKAEKQPLVSLTDKLKLLTGVFFFWWFLMLLMEFSIGAFSVGAFALLFTASFVIYAKSRK
ncbi:hypothetical protein [Ruminococcus sp.]